MTNRRLRGRTGGKRRPAAAVTSREWMRDFELAGLKAYDRRILFIRESDPVALRRLKGFTLALAAAFNDLKNVNWVAHQLEYGRPSLTTSSEINAYRGQWYGMRDGFGRYAIGFMVELGLCIESASDMGVLSLPLFGAALTRMDDVAPAAAEAWRAVVEAFTHRESAANATPSPSRNTSRRHKGAFKNELVQLLIRMRNRTFHYGHDEEFKALLKGYQRYFGVSDRRGGANSSAFVSLGDRQETTRFYFVDGAFVGFVENELEGRPVKDEHLRTFARAVGLALRYVLEGLLDAIASELA